MDERARAPKRIAGLTSPAKAMSAAVAASRAPVVLVVPNDAEVERMTVDARFFLAALEGLSDQDVERAVLPFPSHEVDPYRGLKPHFDIASARARALHGIASGGVRVLVASAAALLPRLAAPDRLLHAAITVTPGRDIAPEALADLLVEAGYTRQDPVDESGEFCVRGGVVDFYPAGAVEPIRLEFVGDTIESIRSYDPATQRSTQALDRASIAPLQELPGDSDIPDRSATVFEYLTRLRPTVLVSEPDEVDAQGRKLYEQNKASYEEAVQKGQRVPPPSELLIDWDTVATWLDGATALDTLALSDDDPGTVHVACQPAWSSRVAFRTGSRKFVAAASGATRWSSSPTLPAAPSGRSSSSLTTTSLPSRWSAPRMRTPPRFSLASAT